ncbi:MAG: pilus (MSHA type) biogenesis protein MshL [Pseudomonadota bacterium]
MTVAACALLAACGGQPVVDFSPGHRIEEETPEPAPTPPVVAEPPAQPEPEPVETYTVVVKDVPAPDLLFSLARDAGLNLDLQTTLDRTVTLNAVERPLQEILGRIASQAGMRYQLLGSNLLIEDDLPYWHNYPIDYVNVSRGAESEVGVATQIATSGGSVLQQQGAGAGGGGQQQDGQGNLSKTVLKNQSQSDFWASLEEGLESIIKSSGQSDAPESHNPVIVNSMASVVTVFGSQANHLDVQRYLNRVMANAARQVLIEMTIVEVELSDNYQAGVDWSRVAADTGDGWNLSTDLLGANLGSSPFVVLNYADTDSSGNSVSATVRLLQQFGDTKVLSSPKVMALNNQTAILKVVNETVFFTVELDIRDATINIPERRNFTSELHTIPVGLVMSVTPQVSNSGFVSLNIRPTISRITGFAVDPAPRLLGADFDNLIPEIQVREIESLLQVLDGRTIVLGGLMQNEEKSTKDGVPGLARIPGVGRLFSYNTDEVVKTELVIFLKPTIIKNGELPPGSDRVSDYYQAPVARAPAKIEYR